MARHQQTAATFSEIEPATPPATTAASAATAVPPSTPPAQSVPAPAEPAANPTVAAPGEFTRCFEVKHDYRGTSYYGAMRVLADTPEEAVAAFCRLKCPEADAETRRYLVTREIAFRPASTEAGKPGGWRRGQKIKSRDGM